jgi:hypothetical protein
MVLNANIGWLIDWWCLMPNWAIFSYPIKWYLFKYIICYQTTKVKGRASCFTGQVEMQIGEARIDSSCQQVLLSALLTNQNTFKMTGDNGYSIKIHSEWQEMTINQSKYIQNIKSIRYKRIYVCWLYQFYLVHVLE